MSKHEGPIRTTPFTLTKRIITIWSIVTNGRIRAGNARRLTVKPRNTNVSVFRGKTLEHQNVDMKQIISVHSLIAISALTAVMSYSSLAHAADEVQRPGKTQTLDLSRLSPDLLDVAKLVQSGVDEAVVFAFIQKNPPQRSPSADELIYLQGLGLSSKAMVALMNAVEKPTVAITAQAVPAPAQSVPVQTTVTAPALVVAPANPPVVYVERPYVDYSYPAWSFGWNLGHHIFGHHGGHHSFGHHGGGHHGGGHHGGHH